MKEQIEKQAIEEMAEAIFQNCNCGLFFSEAEKIARFVVEEQGYRKQSENTVELPCTAGDLVHFKGLETPWKVSAIHFYAEGLPQISITSETGKITSTMNINAFYMFCSVIAKEETKMKGDAE